MFKRNANKKINFRGQKVALAYNLLSYKFLEENGVNIHTLDENELSVTEMLTFVGAGLVYKFPDTTMNELWQSFDTSEFPTLREAVQDALNRFDKKSAKK